MMTAVIKPQIPSGITPSMKIVFSEWWKKKICECDPFHPNSALQFSGSIVHVVIDICTAKVCVSSTEENEHQI